MQKVRSSEVTEDQRIWGFWAHLRIFISPYTNLLVIIIILWYFNLKHMQYCSILVSAVSRMFELQWRLTANESREYLPSWQTARIFQYEVFASPTTSFLRCPTASSNPSNHAWRFVTSLITMATIRDVNTRFHGLLVAMSGQCVICQVIVPGLGYNWTTFYNIQHMSNWTIKVADNWLNILWVFCVLTCRTILLGGGVFQTVRHVHCLDV